MLQDKKNNVKKDTFDEDRSIITEKTFENEKKIVYYKQLFGFILYFVFFILFIPHLLIKNELWYILTAYVPNLDMLATIIGYKGGPYDIWKYLYNPATSTIYGFFSATLINYFALLGVTYIVAFNTHIKRNITSGWSLAFFMLAITYLLPGNLLVVIMNKMGSMVESFIYDKFLSWFIVVLIGILAAIIIIIIESKLIERYNPTISNYIIYVANKYKIKFF